MTLRVHSNRVLGTRFHAKPAVNALSKIDIEALGILLDIGIRVLSRRDVDAMRRAHRLAHHTRHASWRPIGALRQSVAGTKSWGSPAHLIRILDRHRCRHVTEEAKAVGDMQEEIPPEMLGGQEKTLGHRGKIHTLPPSQLPALMRLADPMQELLAECCWSFCVLRHLYQ